MKNVLCSVLVLVACLALLAAAPEEKAHEPQYDQYGQLIRPADYREWMFQSGYGMNYNPGPDSQEMFTNVFVQRWAYSEFAKLWEVPEQSMFVIDERDPASRSSINQEGHYLTDLTGVAVEVKIRRGIRISGRTTFSGPTAKRPRPCPRATSAGRATKIMPSSSTRLCSSIPR